MARTAQKEGGPTKSVRILAPAKINLYLKVYGPDERGYHPLRTVFQAVSLFDEIEVEIEAPPSVPPPRSANHPGGAPRESGPAREAAHSVTFDVDGIPARNTVTRAIELFGRETELPRVSVRVHKRIPLESGLGGGSSDAAAVLRALQKLLGDPVSAEVLRRIALEIGADVPFFLVGGRAVGEGYGEKLSPMPNGPPRSLVIARPNESCPTGPMFKKLDELRNEHGELPNRDPRLNNDFERVAPAACLDLIERIRSLGALRAGLSGSGSAVFGVFDSAAATEAVANTLQMEGVPWAVAARALSRAESLNLAELG